MISEKHCRVVDGFLANADQLRRLFEAHFRDPYAHAPSSHGVWDYWYVPGLYTYLRADPRRIIPPQLVDLFVGRLQRWSIENLGCANVTQPILSLYVDGCRQGLHNDAANGQWGYVWSLTAPGVPFVGGSTILMRPHPYWGTSAMDHPIAGSGLYETCAPAFNRLLVFDDRLVHGVETVEGNMNPLDGRVVLHGHLREGEPWVAGGLTGDRAAVHAALTATQERLSDMADASGGVAVRLNVGEAGRVIGAAILTDRVRAQPPVDLDRLLRRCLADLRFPSCAQVSVVVAWLKLAR